MSFYYYLVFLSLNLVHDLTAFVVRIFVIVADFSLASAFGIAFFFFLFFFSQSLIDTFFCITGPEFQAYIVSFFFLDLRLSGVASVLGFPEQILHHLLSSCPSPPLFHFIYFFFNSIVWLSFLSTPPDTSFMSTTVSFLFLTSGIVFADNPSFVILLLLIFSA